MPKTGQAIFTVGEFRAAKHPQLTFHTFHVIRRDQKISEKQTTSVASPVVENYYFPQKLQECILGGLPYSKITRAYKGYKYGVNSERS